MHAPDGTKPGTVWIWLITFALPIVGFVAAIPATLAVTSVLPQFVHAVEMADREAVYASNPVDPAPLWRDFVAATQDFLGPQLGWILLALGTALVMQVLLVVFAWLDYRALERREVPAPFHWGWSFFTFAGTGNLVTVLGRSSVVYRRTGRGLAPIWWTVALVVLGAVGSGVLVWLLVSTALFGAHNDVGPLQVG